MRSIDNLIGECETLSMRGRICDPDQVLSLTAEIRRLRDRTRWHPMSEAIPEGVGMVLVKFGQVVGALSSAVVRKLEGDAVWAYLPEDAAGEDLGKRTAADDELMMSYRQATRRMQDTGKPAPDRKDLSFRPDENLTEFLARTNPPAPEPASPWQPIATVPRDGEVIDLWSGRKQRRIACCYWSKSFNQWICESGNYTVDDATHWIRQPSPPIAPAPEPSDAEKLEAIASYFDPPSDDPDAQKVITLRRIAQRLHEWDLGGNK